MDTVAYLEDSDFMPDGMLKLKKPVICLIYANWCPPCVDFKPVYYQLTEILPMHIACIELDGHLPGQKELAARVGKIVPNFAGTPTVCMFVDGDVVAVYEGDRTIESLVDFARPFLARV